MLLNHKYLPGLSVVSTFLTTTTFPINFTRIGRLVLPTKSWSYWRQPDYVSWSLVFSLSTLREIFPLCWLFWYHPQCLQKSLFPVCPKCWSRFCSVDWWEWSCHAWWNCGFFKKPVTNQWIHVKLNVPQGDSLRKEKVASLYKFDKSDVIGSCKPNNFLNTLTYEI